MPESRLDAVDISLIHAFQEDPRASYAAVARVTGVSEKTVKRRAEALMADGVIYPAIILDPRIIGYRASAILLIKAEPRYIRDVADELCSWPEVGYLSLAVGEWNIMCYAIQPSLREMADFIADRIAPLAGVQAVETVMTPHFLKVFAGWRLPIQRTDEDPLITAAETPLKQDAAG